MKRYAFLLTAMAACAHAEPAAKAPVTARELASRPQSQSLSALPQENPAAAKHVTVHTAGSQSIIASSQVLHDGENWTLVPKGAVLFVPEGKMDRVGARAIGTLLPWIEFLRKNPAWVSTYETSFEQASGDAKFPAANVDFWQKQDKVIIAVHQGGPISVAN